MKEWKINIFKIIDTRISFYSRNTHLLPPKPKCSTVYDERDDFDFEIVNFPFLDGDVPRSTSYGVYIINAFIYLEHPAMLLTSSLAINC